jgi:signal transduction histidine kinase
MDEARCREMVELVRSVRHDVNSPLTAALGNVQLLADEPAAGDPEVRESLRVIERELRRMMEILARLKDVKAD